MLHHLCDRSRILLAVLSPLLRSRGRRCLGLCLLDLLKRLLCLDRLLLHLWILRVCVRLLIRLLIGLLIRLLVGLLVWLLVLRLLLRLLRLGKLLLGLSEVELVRLLSLRWCLCLCRGLLVGWHCLGLCYTCTEVDWGL